MGHAAVVVQVRHHVFLFRIQKALVKIPSAHGVVRKGGQQCGNLFLFQHQLHLAMHRDRLHRNTFRQLHCPVVILQPFGAARGLFQDVRFQPVAHRQILRQVGVGSQRLGVLAGPCQRRGRVAGTDKRFRPCMVVRPHDPPELEVAERLRLQANAAQDQFRIRGEEPVKILVRTLLPALKPARRARHHRVRRECIAAGPDPVLRQCPVVHGQFFVLRPTQVEAIV